MNRSVGNRPPGRLIRIGVSVIPQIEQLFPSWFEAAAQRPRRTAEDDDRAFEPPGLYSQLPYDH